MIIISSGAQAIQVFGSPKVARRKTLVYIREVVGEEFFYSNSSSSELKAVEGIDYIVIPVDGENLYPCKKDVVIPVDGEDLYPCKKEIFHNSWVETETTGVYREKALYKVIPIPKGNAVTLKTLEGDVVVSHPAWIAIGIADEVYSYSSEWVEKNLELVS